MHPTGSAVNGENYTDVLRDLDVHQPTEAMRSLRDAAARYEVRSGLEHLNDGDTDSAIRSLRVAMLHYTPAFPPKSSRWRAVSTKWSLRAATKRTHWRRRA